MSVLYITTVANDFVCYIQFALNQTSSTSVTRHIAKFKDLKDLY
jgi:hypothetical protein